jgi:uncharacterized integral membrane protein
VTEPAPTPSPDPRPAPSRRDPLRRSRASSAWFAIAGLALLLLLLVVFIAQNTQSVRIAYFGWDGRAPLAVSLLAAAVAGILLAVVAGSLRILQLRRRVRRDVAGERDGR